MHDPTRPPATRARGRRNPGGPSRCRRAFAAGALAALVLCAGCGSGAGGRFVALTSEAAFEEEVLRAQQPVLFEFHRAGCMACASIGPTLARVSEEFADRARFVKVERSRAGNLRYRYAVGAYPTVILFLGGRQRARWVAEPSGRAYREALDAALREGADRPGDGGSPPRLKRLWFAVDDDQRGVAPVLVELADEPVELRAANGQGRQRLAASLDVGEGLVAPRLAVPSSNPPAHLHARRASGDTSAVPVAAPVDSPACRQTGAAASELPER